MRVPQDCLNKKSIESFIRAGAFDDLGHSRLGLMTVYEMIINDSIERRTRAEQGVMSLFDAPTDDGADHSGHLDIPISDKEYDKSIKLKFEKEVLGLYLSDHPLRGYESSLRRVATATTADVDAIDSGAIVTFAGILAKVDRKVTKKGDPMAVVQLEDLHGGLELTVFSRTLQQHAHKIHEDAVVAVKCRVNRQDDRLSIAVLEVTPAVLAAADPELRLNMPATNLDPDKVSRLKSILSEYPGSAQVYLHVGGSKVLRLGEDFNVDVDRVIPPLRVAFGAEVIR